MLERLRTDLVRSARSLSSTPLLVLAAIATLAVSVGVNLAMFGLIDRAILRPAAHVVAPETLFTIGIVPPGAKPGSAVMTSTSYIGFTSIRDDVPAVSSAAAFMRNTTTLVLEGDQREVRAMTISEEYFDTLGVSPMLGRGIHAGDDLSTAEAPVVVSHAFWRSALSGDAGVIGKKLTIGGLEYVVSGVMPQGFSGHSPVDTDCWLTFAGAMRDNPGWDRDSQRNVTSVVVRIAADQNPATAATQAGAVIDRDVILQPVISSGIAATEKRIAWWLAGVSMAVFGIGLANVATLLLVRSARLRRDVAVRAALGASRSQLVREGMLDSGLLAVLATLASLALSLWLDEAVRRVLLPGIVEQTTLNLRVVMAAIGAGVIAAIAGAIANTRHVGAGMNADHFANAVAGGGRTRTMTAMLLVQVTLSVMLLAGAGMFGGSLYRLLSQDFGMEMSRVLLINARMGPGGQGPDARIYTEALDRIRQLPEVETATVINTIPFAGMNVPPIAVPDRPAPAVGQQLPFLVAATPEYFSMLGIRVIEGRGLTDADDRGTPVVMVNQTMAGSVWPGESAIGKCIRIGFPAGFQPEFGDPVPDHTVPCREVVGIVNDTRQRSLFPQDNEDRLMQYYVPFSQVPYPPFIPQDEPRVAGLLVRPERMTPALVTTLRRLLVGERTDLPFIEIRPYAQVLDRQLQPWRTATTLLVLFSALALLVASIGLYAAFAYAVAERRREMAIRLAVGARPTGVMAMVLREAVILAVIGAAIGCAATVGAGRLVVSLLYGTEPSDPIVLGGAALLILIVVMLATILPAKRASQADPSVLLRTN